MTPPVTPSASVTSSFGPQAPTTSSYPSHYQQPPHQQNTFFPKKEFQGGHLSDFYQPPTSSFTQYSGSNPGEFGYDPHPEDPSGSGAHSQGPPSSLTHALQGVMHGSVLGTIRNVKRGQFASAATSG